MTVLLRHTLPTNIQRGYVLQVLLLYPGSVTGVQYVAAFVVVSFRSGVYFFPPLPT